MALASALGFRINNVSAYFRHITTKLNIGRVRNYAKWGACFIVRKTAKTECYITLSRIKSIYENWKSCRRVWARFLNAKDICSVPHNSLLIDDHVFAS